MTQEQSGAVLVLLEHADRLLPKLNAVVLRDEIAKLKEACRQVRLHCHELEKLMADFKYGCASRGDCQACQDAVLADPALVLGRSWVGIHAQQAGPPFHWAKQVGEVAVVDRSCLWNRTFKAACGHVFTIQVDTGD